VKNKDDNTPLHFMAREFDGTEESRAILLMVLQRGINVDHKNSNGETGKQKKKKKKNPKSFFIQLPFFLMCSIDASVLEE
jgi:hypothetical protein